MGIMVCLVVLRINKYYIDCIINVGVQRRYLSYFVATIRAYFSSLGQGLLYRKGLACNKPNL